MTTPTRYRFTPDVIEYTRKRYEESDDRQEDIAADLGVSRWVLDRMAKREGWKLRKNVPVHELTPTARLDREVQEAMRRIAAEQQDAEAPASDAPVSRSAIIERLERAVEKELAAVERMRRFGGPSLSASSDAERNARTLASLTETLNRVQRLRAAEEHGSGASEYDDIPHDIDEFRCALAQRIEAFVRSRADRPVSQNREGPGPDESAS